MANDNLTLAYNVPVRVYVSWLNNSNIERPVTNRTKAAKIIAGKDDFLLTVDWQDHVVTLAKINL